MAKNNAPVSVKSYVGVQRVESLLMVDPRELHIIPGFNPRLNLGDLTSLKAQIKAQGVLEPLRVWQKDGRLFVISGHKRKACCDLLDEEGARITAVPCVLEDSKINEVDMLLRAYFANEGTPISEYDEANVFRRFMAYGDTLAQVAARTGKSETVISQRLDLLKASPDMIRDLQDGKIGVSLLLKAIKKADKDGTTQRQAADDIKKANPDLRGAAAKAAKKAAEEKKAQEDAQARQAEIDKAVEIEKLRLAQERDARFSSAFPPLPPVEASSTSVEPFSGSTLTVSTSQGGKVDSPPSQTPKMAIGVNTAPKAGNTLPKDDDLYADLVDSGQLETANSLTLPYPRLKANMHSLFVHPDYSLRMILAVIVRHYTADAVAQTLGAVLAHEAAAQERAKASVTVQGSSPGLKPFTPGAPKLVTKLGEPGSAQRAIAEAGAARRAQTETAIPPATPEAPAREPAAPAVVPPAKPAKRKAVKS
jgi:hypothetical protein